MFIFLRAYLAHLIADYPLQTDRIYAFKVRSLMGIILHSGIVAITNDCVASPPIRIPYCEHCRESVDEILLKDSVQVTGETIGDVGRMEIKFP